MERHARASQKRASYPKDFAGVANTGKSIGKHARGFIFASALAVAKTDKSTEKLDERTSTK